MAPVIQTHGLTKSFGRTAALTGLDLTVERGSVHAFLGPNGAGKSTTLRILLGLLRRSGGHAEVLGADPWRDAVDLHRRLAYVPGDVALWPNLSGGEAIDLLGELRGSQNRARRDELVERFRLDPTRRCGTYSKGNRQKVALVAGLAADVDLYLLDEPTSGLDPLMEVAFQDVVREIARRGGTVLLSSHILAEAEVLCDTVSIIRDGRVVETGTLAALRHVTRSSLHVTTREPLTTLATWPGVYDAAVTSAGTEARFGVAADELGAMIARLANHGIRTLTTAPPTLEELFLRHYTDADDARPTDPAPSTARPEPAR